MMSNKVRYRVEVKKKLIVKNNIIFVFLRTRTVAFLLWVIFLVFIGVFGRRNDSFAVVLIPFVLLFFWLSFELLWMASDSVAGTVCPVELPSVFVSVLETQSVLLASNASSSVFRRWSVETALPCSDLALSKISRLATGAYRTNIDVSTIPTMTSDAVINSKGAYESTNCWSFRTQLLWYFCPCRVYV